MNQLIGLAEGLVLFLCLLIAYITGIKHGKQISQGIVPNVNLNPVKAIVKIKEDKKLREEQDKAYQGWHGKQGIINYDPYNVKKEDE